jgi:hypothetical protein
MKYGQPEKYLINTEADCCAVAAVRADVPDLRVQHDKAFMLPYQCYMRVSWEYLVQPDGMERHRID